MDRLTVEQRSRNMSRIRGRDTRPELIVRSFLHRQGLRFRVHRTDLPGRPDIALAGSRLAIFVHGCFWHRHPQCRFAYSPRSNVTFWNQKFERNQLRDAAVMNALREKGWHPVVVWECEVQNVALLRRHILALHQRRRTG
jgi:DNA mismatch endonuclease, patch repair protein